MEKPALITALRAEIQDLSQLLASCNDEVLNRRTGSSWTIAQQADHLRKSVSPVTLALSLPKWTLFLFGRASGSRSYDEIVALYRQKLSSGARAPLPFVPAGGKTWEQAPLQHSFDRAHKAFLARLEEWSETDLDTYRVPHPLIGILTMREMACFTRYHLHHHLLSMRELL